MSGQVFERLIKLEDEELNNDDNSDAHLDNKKDSCTVPMIPASGNGSLENLFPGLKHKKQEHLKTITGQSAATGFSFTIKNRHIHINPEQLKYISLITLTVQNAALNLTMRAARTQTEQFSTPIAVTVAEFFKLISCLVLILFDEMSINRVYKSIKVNIIENYIDTLKVAIPSFVYYIQNNLLYVGSTHLDAATTQVTYQLKILTTAVFSVLMLNKKLTKIQWIALITLFLGVALIEMMVVSDNKAQKSFSTKNSSSLLKVDDDNNNLKTVADEIKKEKPLLGFFAILVACCLSGFAGVYFEKILKNTSHVSLWIRNIQLSIVAIPIGLIQVFILDSKHVETKGFFYGFTPLTWLCIILQVQGGLLVAVVVKYANNILKGFATSMAIVISTVASIFLFNFNLTFSFIFGASLVISSVMMYNKQ